MLSVESPKTPMAGAESEDWRGLSALEGTSEVVDNTFIGQHDSGDTPLPIYTEPVSDPLPRTETCVYILQVPLYIFYKHR